MPHERIAFTPHPVWGKTPEELRVYVDGPDPVSGKPLMPEIVDFLTVPLSAEEKKIGQSWKSPTGPATYGPDTPKNLQQYYLDNGMTDYLPIIIPTEEAVDEMCTGTSHKPDEAVGKMAAGAYPPWTYTVRHVAINAVMAGCRPEYFPIVLAIASSGIASLFSSTNSFAFSMIVNGPIRDKLVMNYGIGSLGPFAQPNATLGRAWTHHVEKSRQRRHPRRHLPRLGRQQLELQQRGDRRRRSEQPVGAVPRAARIQGRGKRSQPLPRPRRRARASGARQQRQHQPGIRQAAQRSLQHVHRIFRRAGDRRSARREAPAKNRATTRRNSSSSGSTRTRCRR